MENNANGIPTKKKKLIYSLVIAVCMLLLAAATVLTVYFVTTGENSVLDNPPEDSANVVNPDNPSNPTGGDENQPSNPTGGDENQPSNPTGGNENQPSNPTGGESVRFVAPVQNAVCSVEYASIYTNLTLKGQVRKHMGVDYTAEEGTSVVAIAAGKVASVSIDSVLGNMITIDHGDGLISCYRFVEPVEELKVGDTVTKGQEIARVAAAYGTEQFAGTHLHFELSLNGNWVDPSAYFEVTYEEK